ncbi:MAG: ATP synthase subunit I [Cyanobacteria bacterium J06634_6]
MTNVTSAEDPAVISLNLSALAEENIGSAISELETAAESNAEESASNDGASNTEGEQPIVLPPASETSMEDYFQLQQNLLKLTLVFTLVICLCVWWAYSIEIALNYVVGAVTGIVYFRMLAKSVGKIGREKPKPSSARFAVFVGVMVASTQWQQLSVLPVFLGFLTYKAALIAFVIWTAAFPQQEPASSV